MTEKSTLLIKMRATPKLALFGALRATGVSAAHLENGLQRMAKRAATFVESGDGPAAKAYQKLGISSRDLEKNLSDRLATFETVVRPFDKVDDLPEIYALAARIFGDESGPHLVPVIKFYLSDE